MNNVFIEMRDYDEFKEKPKLYIGEPYLPFECPEGCESYYEGIITSEAMKEYCRKHLPKQF